MRRYGEEQVGYLQKAMDEKMLQIENDRYKVVETFKNDITLKVQ